MIKIIMFVILIAGILPLVSDAQKRYGYAILHFKCGSDDPQRNRVYYSPIIELNTLNFPRYTDGIDPAIPVYSVRYYNYAISKWFESFVKQYYNIQINDPNSYERKFKSIVFNEKNASSCNDTKTNADCFFTDKEELSIQREEAVRESKLPIHEAKFCEVISLK